MIIRPPVDELEPAPADSWTGDRTADASLFFTSAEHTRLLELIRHLLENSADIVLVCGDDGAGKSTLLYRLQAEAPEHWLFCRLDANPMMHADQLLNNLARRLNAPDGSEQTLERLSAAFSGLRLQGRLPVVLVDDADQLPISSLMLLLRLHERKPAETDNFALLLLAHSRIADTLNTHQLHAMGTAGFNQLELPPLRVEQTGDYVRHYLRLEGAPEDIALSPEQLARIHRRSRGLPGKINEQVIRTLREPSRNALRIRLPRQLPQWLPRLPPITLAGVAALALLLLITLIFQEEINALFASGDESTARSGSTRANPPAPDANPDPALPHLIAPMPPPPREIAGIRDEQTPSVDIPLALPPMAQSLDPSTDGVQSPPPIPDPTPPAMDAMVLDEPLIPPTAKSDSREQTVPGPAEPEAMKTEPAPPPLERPPTSAPDLRPDEAWLMRQDPGHYSLQLLAGGSESAVLRYLRRTSVRGKRVYYESSRAGKPWFVVLHGLYPDRGAAVAALSELPPGLRKAGAWPRTIGSVQSAIRQRIRR